MYKAAATRRLPDFLIDRWPNEKARNAPRRMRQVICTPGWRPDILIKMLPDMNEASLNGLLRSRVRVSWEDEASIQSSSLHPNFANVLGATAFDDRDSLCYNRLNRRGICFNPDEPRELMSQALVHEKVARVDSTVPLGECLQ